MFERAHHRRIAARASGAGRRRSSQRCLSAAARRWRCATANTASPSTSTSSFPTRWATARCASCSPGARAAGDRCARRARTGPRSPRGPVRHPHAGARDGATIKFEIVLEARIALEMPADARPHLRRRDARPRSTWPRQAARQLRPLGDDAVNSRDLIDLAMMRPSQPLLGQGLAKAKAAYGKRSPPI